jgi:hypothetical protein
MPRHGKEEVKHMLKDGVYIRSCAECKFYIRFPIQEPKGRCLEKKVNVDFANAASYCDFWECVPDVPQ